MSDPAPEKVDLGQIKGPDQEPPKEPDRKTKREINRAKKTPTERAVDRHVTYIKADCDRLREHVEQLQSDLDKLRPEHAALRESHRNLTVNGTFGVIAYAVASAALGAGGFITSNAKFYVLAVGIALTVCAIAIQIINCAGWHKPPAPPDGPKPTPPRSGREVP